MGNFFQPLIEKIPLETAPKKRPQGVLQLPNVVSPIFTQPFCTARLLWRVRQKYDRISPLSQKSEIFASSPGGGAFGTDVRLIRITQTVSLVPSLPPRGRCHGTAVTERISRPLRGRWHGVAVTERISLPLRGRWHGVAVTERGSSRLTLQILFSRNRFVLPDFFVLCGRNMVEYPLSVKNQRFLPAPPEGEPLVRS